MTTDSPPRLITALTALAVVRRVHRGEEPSLVAAEYSLTLADVSRAVDAYHEGGRKALNGAFPV